jgi:hypothetical protein
MTTDKTTSKNVLVMDEYAGFPPQYFADAMMYIIASPPSDEAINVILNQNLSPKFQKKFYLTQKELYIFNNLKKILDISHDYQLAHLILNNSQQNPIFRF